MQMLGWLIGLRGRHRECIGLLAAGETVNLLVRTLFPENRRLYVSQIGASVQLSDRRLHVGEPGHHTGLARWLRGESDRSRRANEIEAGFAINAGG
jgi:hypothetical protein